MRSENSPGGRRPSFIEEARRAQIIQAATETVAELGYANASLAQIANRADISKSVISYHFDGKDELLEQVVTQYFEEVWAYMQPRVEAATSPAARIRAWVESQIQFFTQHRQGFLAMVEIVSNHRRSDGSRPFDHAEEEEIQELTRILSEGQRIGEFRDFDAHAVAVIIGQTMEAALSRWAYGELTNMDAHLPALLDFIDHAIRR
jgi:AcrR family transcriptional regulator